MSKAKYETYVLPRLQSIESWVLEGLDEDRIAQRLGICCQTLKKYKKEHKSLREILDNGRVDVIASVENALLKKAKGYKYTEIKTVDKGDRLEITTTEKEMPPDLSAISFLLKNYCPEKWGDKSLIKEKEQQGGGVVILPDILEEDKSDEAIQS